MTLVKASELAGMVLFTVIAPRLMGPRLFGEFAVILSVSGVFSVLCAIGGGPLVFGRFVPEYLARNEERRAKVLLMHLLGFRVLAALVGAPLLFVLLRRFLPLASMTTLLAAVAAFPVAAIAGPMFAVFFGYNRLALSMVRTAFERFLLLGLVLALGAGSSLERAAISLLVANLCVLGFGVVLARQLFTVDREILDLRAFRQHIFFGTSVFTSSFLLQVPRRLGETALAFGGFPAAQIGLFNIASSGCTAIAQLLEQLPKLLIPSLSLQQARGNESSRDEKLGLTIKYLTLLAVLCALGALVAGHWVVRLMLGPDFLGVVPHLQILAVSLLPVPLVRTAFSLAVVRGRVTASLWMGAAAGVVFIGSLMLLTPLRGAHGASIAILLAGIAAGLVALGEMADTTILREAKAALHGMAIIGAVIALLALGASPLAGVIATIVYLILLRGLAVVTLGELVALVRAAMG